jgi:ABC-type oligopeptide transport system ATPase subunit
MSEKNIALNNVVQIFRGAAMRSLGGEFRAVDDVSFDLESEPPQIVSLVGQSGSGKSTIARIMLGLQKPSSGSVTYNGKDIYKLSRQEYDIYRKDVQPVFQDPYSIYNPFYRVDRVFWTAMNKFKLASSKQEGLAKIEESLHAVDLRPEDVLNRYPHQLSGGQRQRVMLARVHLLRPKFIIADEPVSMLDAAVRVLFLNILADFTEKYGMTTLFITHDLSTAYYVGGKIWLSRVERSWRAGMWSKCWCIHRTHIRRCCSPRFPFPIPMPDGPINRLSPSKKRKQRNRRTWKPFLIHIFEETRLQLREKVSLAISSYVYQTRSARNFAADRAGNLYSNYRTGNRGVGDARTSSLCRASIRSA